MPTSPSSYSQARPSVAIFTFNEEKNIEACLRSVAGWCPEIYVIDSGSTDRTLEIVRRFTEKIVFHAFVDHATQCDWMLRNVVFSSEWLLRLDADNVVSENLKNAILGALKTDEPGVDGYYAVHRYFFRRKPVRGFKGHLLCLVRHKNIHIDRSELVDFRLVPKGTTKVLRGEMYEDNRNEDNIDFWIDKHQKFSTRLAAEEVLRRSGLVGWSLRPRLLGSPDERIIWLKERWYHLPLYVRPVIYFVYRYFWRLGFLDGVNGMVYHFLHAFWYRLVVDIKIAALREELGSGRVSLNELSAKFLNRFPGNTSS